MSDNKMDGLSMDLEAESRSRLAAVFPECFSEGKLDLEKLLALCGSYTADDFEKYEFRWKGKADCLKLAQKRSAATLRPCRAESVDFDTTQNLYIEGDNLEVLKLLQTAYYRQVKMIYIDPPYNTGHDFVYADDFADPLAKYKEVTQQATKSNPETMGRYHTNWLNMMYPRLRLASNLLRDDGVIFISIDDNEVDNLKKLCNEVFGEENFVATFPWRKRTAKSDVPFGVSQDFEWLICYAKTMSFSASIDGQNRRYYETPDFPGRPWRIHDLTKQTTAAERPKSFFTIVNPKTKQEYPANPNRTWAITEDTFLSYYASNRIVFPGDYDFLDISRPALRYWQSDDMEKAGEDFGRKAISTKLIDSIGMSQDGTKELTELMGNKVFPFPKPVALIKYLVSAINDKNALILDFFSGSATLAHAVMQLNAEDGGTRRFILIQLPELCSEDSEAFKSGYKNICEIGKERIRRAGQKIKEANPLFTGDIGFKVFKLDSSNLKLWDGSPLTQDDLLTLSERLNDMIDRVKPDRTDEDVIAEIMLKLGIPLTEPVSRLDFEGHAVYSVGKDSLLLICLQDKLSTEDLEKMAEYAPGTIVLSESALADDSAMSNAHYILKNRGIELKLI